MKKKPSDPKDRLTISVPRGLLDVLRPISLQLDLEYSKVLMVGLDAFVRDNRHKISRELYYCVTLCDGQNFCQPQQRSLCRFNEATGHWVGLFANTLMTVPDSASG